MGMVFCPVLTHPSMSLQNHPDLIPVPLYFPLILFSPGILGLFPEEIHPSCQTTQSTADWLTAPCLLHHALLYFSILGNASCPTLSTGFITSALPFSSPALPFPALPRSLPRTSQSLGVSWGCSRDGCGQWQWEFLPQTQWSLCNYWYLRIALASL